MALESISASAETARRMRLEALEVEAERWEKHTAVLS